MKITDEIRSAVYLELADDIDDHSLLSAENLRKRAEEKDPPRPEPGTVVLYRVNDETHWFFGVVASAGKKIYGNHGFLGFDGIEWKPARILWPDEVVIQRPHTDVWPMTVDRKPAIRADLVWHFIDSSGRCFNQKVAKHGSITRTEAEAMEAEHDM